MFFEPYRDALLAERTILLAGLIDDELATKVIAKLLILDDEDPSAPAVLLLDSRGGHVSAALAVRDTVDDVACPVRVHALDEASGMAAVLLAHGRRGERTASPTSLVKLTPISPQESAEVERVETLLAGFLAEDTGQTQQTILRDMRAGRCFTPEDAREYGLVDRIHVHPTRLL